MATKKSTKKTNKNASSTRPAIEVIEFAKRYRGRKRYAVDHVSFAVAPGEFHGFIGANGAGKTTTIKSIIGAYSRYKGTVKIYGKENKKIEAKQHIGYIPEKAEFPGKMSLRKYLQSMAEISGKSIEDAKAFAQEQINDLGLQGVAGKSPNGFSSGQKKKVLLAQAMVSDPDVLIMDEPAANLDPKARNEFFTILRRIQRQGKTIFLSSHILTELDQFVSHVTILDNGKVVYTGPTKPLVKNKDLKYTFKLENANNHDKFMALARKHGARQAIVKGLKAPSKKYVNLTVHTKENLFNIVHAASKAKIYLLEYKEIVLSLQDVYNKFVKVGSVDTPEHLKAKGKKGGKHA